MERRGETKGKKSGERGKKGRKKISNWKVVFWNVAELGNKDKEFWEELKRWDVMLLFETWVEEKEWRGIREKLPKDFS